MRTPYRIGYVPWLGLAGLPPAEILARLTDLGYSGISWTLDQFNPRSKKMAELRQLVEMTEARGFEIPEIVVQQDYVCLDEGKRRDRIALTRECIEAAGGLGLHVINVFTGPAPWDPCAPELHRDISEGAAWELVLDAFAQLLPTAEQYQVHLAVEAVFGHLCHDYYTTSELLGHFKSPFLSINMDPSHYQLYRNDVAWVVRRWGDRIKHVHLKDAVGRPGTNREDFHFPLLGEGTVPWLSFIEALEDVGYEGCLSVEFESLDYYRNVLCQDALRAAELSMQAARALLHNASQGQIGTKPRLPA